MVSFCYEVQLFCGDVWFQYFAIITLQQNIAHGFSLNLCKSNTLAPTAANNAISIKV